MSDDAACFDDVTTPGADDTSGTASTDTDAARNPDRVVDLPLDRAGRVRAWLLDLVLGRFGKVSADWREPALATCSAGASRWRRWTRCRLLLK